TCVQNRVQYAPTVPHLALEGPLYVLDLSWSERLAAASQAGCHGFDPRSRSIFPISISLIPIENQARKITNRQLNMHVSRGADIPGAICTHCERSGSCCWGLRFWDKRATTGSSTERGRLGGALGVQWGEGLTRFTCFPARPSPRCAESLRGFSFPPRREALGLWR